MFKSIQHLNGHDPKTKLYSYVYKIIDEDFEEEISEASVAADAGADAVIKTYSKRNLNVPKNLFLLFMFYEKEYGKKYYSIEQQIVYCMKYQPFFLKYKKDVEKYLLLI
jgi:hypothetical protein